MEQQYLLIYHRTDHDGQYGRDGKIFRTEWLYVYHIWEIFLHLFLIQISFFKFTSLSYWQFIYKHWPRYLTAGYYPHPSSCNKAVCGLPFHPHVELTPVCRNDSGPSQLPSLSIKIWSFMYVTLIQNISASTWSVSSLCDSLKHLNLHQINLFLSQNLAITLYSTLYEKWTLFIRIHLYEIDTSPTTYLIGAHWRWTSNAVLSHTYIYLTYCEEFIQYTHKIPNSYIE